MSEPSEIGTVSIWLRDIEQGDSNALNMLCERYLSLLQRTAHACVPRRGSTVEDADDVASRTLWRCVASLAHRDEDKRIRDRESLWIFMMVILHSVVVDSARRNRAKKRGSGKNLSLSHFLGTDSESQLVGLVDSRTDQETVVAIHDSIEYLLFDKLKNDDTREVARLKLEGYTNQEVADLLNIDVTSVRRKLRRIKKLWLKELGFIEEDGVDDAENTDQ